MGLLKDVAHIAGNIMKVNSLWHDVRMIVIRDRGVDLERLPKNIKMQLYDRVKQEYLNGSTSAESIVALFTGLLSTQDGKAFLASNVHFWGTYGTLQSVEVGGVSGCYRCSG
ncbi:hypothetical protein [Trinickia acidisoli]|uniref:hypothetical protein n=1 Tax=Trinickia acidisoli TaxID=2767482 RepID=UPI001A8CFC23|nr:hypothetical protein [Trinickia acidisoli]